MKKNTYIVLIHIIIQLLYTVLILWDLSQSVDAGHRMMAFMFTMAFAMAIHFVLAILFVIVHSIAKRSDLVRAQFLGLGLAMLIGGSACFIAPGLLT